MLLCKCWRNHTRHNREVHEKSLPFKCTDFQETSSHSRNMARHSLHQNANLQFGYVKIHFIWVRLCLWISRTNCLCQCQEQNACSHSHLHSPLLSFHCLGITKYSTQLSVHIKMLWCSAAEKWRGCFLKRTTNSYSPEGSVFQRKSEWTASAQFKQYLRRGITTVCKNYKAVNMNGGEAFYKKVQSL